MGIHNFFIVFFFNLFLIIRWGWKDYLELYSYHTPILIKIAVWLFAIWGIANLIYALN